MRFDDDDDVVICFVLDQHTEFDFYSTSSLKWKSVARNVPPHWHNIILTLNHSLFLIIIAACLVEKQQHWSFQYSLVNFWNIFDRDYFTQTRQRCKLAWVGLLSQPTLEFVTGNLIYCQGNHIPHFNFFIENI